MQNMTVLLTEPSFGYSLFSLKDVFTKKEKNDRKTFNFLLLDITSEAMGEVVKTQLPVCWL